MQIVTKALAVLAVLCASVLFAGLYDVGHFGLGKMIEPFALVPIGLFVVGSIMPVFVRSRSAPSGVIDTEGLTEKIKEVRTKISSRISSLQATVDGFSGQDRDSIVEENKQLKLQLEAIQQAERDKVLADAQELRSRNEMLEKQIEDWAIKTVDSVIATADAEIQTAA